MRFLIADILKGTVQRYFRTPFFYYLNLPGPLTNGLKNIFDFGEDFAELFKF